MIWRIVPFSYWAIVGLIRVCMAVYLRGHTVEGRDNVPKDGGAIIVANHLNNADPCIIPGVFPRRMNIMAKKEMFKWPVVSVMFRLIGSFPVDRQGADLAALRESQNLIAGGNLLLMFPEGTRSKDRQMHAGFPGQRPHRLPNGRAHHPCRHLGHGASEVATPVLQAENEPAR